MVRSRVIPIGTFIKQFIKPFMIELIANGDNEKLLMCLEIISELMKPMQNPTEENKQKDQKEEKEDKLWNIRISEMIFDQVVIALNILDKQQTSHLFENSFGGDINEYLHIHKDRVFKLLKGTQKQKVISGLFWKPNNLFNNGEVKMSYIEEHNCNFASISMLFSIITIERGVDLFLHVMLTQNYTVSEMKGLIEEMNVEIFQSQAFSQKIISMLKHLVNECNEENSEDIDRYIMTELENWYNTETENKIECNICVVNGFFYTLSVVFKNNHSVDLIDAFIQFITLPNFSKEESQTLTLIINTICESTQHQMEIEPIKTQPQYPTEMKESEQKETNEIKEEKEQKEDELITRSRLMMKGITNYLIKCNQSATTTDIVLIDNIIHSLTLIFTEVLEHEKGKELVIEFGELLEKSGCSLSFIKYIQSQLPFLTQILEEHANATKSDDDFCIKYHPKQQPTYANLLVNIDDSEIVSIVPFFTNETTSTD